MSMKISRLYLKDIRCFDVLEMDLPRSGSSVLVIGENGDGKSTLLRSLAMGLCDQSSASALFRELPGDYVRYDSEEGEGRIEVDLAEGSYNYRIVTKIKSLKTFERVEQELYCWRGHNGKKEELSQDDFPWCKIFASGYGAGIRMYGTEDFEKYLTVDAVYPLFRYDAPLQNPELVVRRLIDQARKANGDSQVAAEHMLSELKQLLARFLDLEDEDQVRLTTTGISVTDARWGEVALSSLGDGYKSIVTLVLDMISCWYLKRQQENNGRSATAVDGIVVIDEVEQHLHPRWQSNMVSRLTSSFPDVQFIAATHSPLVASGCSDVVVYQAGKGQDIVETPYGWLAEDVYRLMGLDSSRVHEIRELIAEFEKLDREQRQRELTKQQSQKMDSIRGRLRQLPGTDPVVLSKELQNLAEELKALEKDGK